MPASSPAGAHRVFLTVWAAQAVSILGSSVASFVLALEIERQTHNPTVLAFMLAVSMVGSIYLAPVVGAVIDRYGSARVALLGCLVSGGLSAALAWLALGNLGDAVPALLTLLLLSGIADAACALALVASVRRLRSEADLTRVNSVLGVVEASPAIAGPVLGGVAAHLISASTVFALDAASFVLCAVAIRLSGWASTETPSRDASPPRLFVGAVEGVRYIWRDAGLRTLQLAMAVSNACNGCGAAALTFFVAAGARELGGSSETALAATRVAAAVGLIAGSAVVGVLGPRLNRHLAVSGALVVGALLGRAALGVSDGVVVWALICFVRNACVGLMNAPLTAAWQEYVPVERQGSVLGGRRLLGQGAYPLFVLLGGAVTGWLTPSLGSVEAARWVLVGAGVVEALAGAWLLLSPPVRRRLTRDAAPSAASPTS